jgi:hypothetical protein
LFRAALNIVLAVRRIEESKTKAVVSEETPSLDSGS